MEDIYYKELYNTLMYFIEEEYKDSILITHKDFALRCINLGITDVLFFCSEEIKNDKEVALLAMENDPLSYCYISEELRNDTDIISKKIEYIKRKRK